MASPAKRAPAPNQILSESSGLDKLLSADQAILLDTVDKLRSYGLSKYVRLPQIIVCGDQSSGKSSVLEAISRISFPRGDGLCTTFPTELALRREPTRTVKVRLTPASTRPEAEKNLLASYTPQAGNFDDFESLITGARDHLIQHGGKNRAADSFFEDSLRVEVTDPVWPPLSLVDLPGLISSPNPRQRPEDVTVVTDMVAKYMENPKSIILAVVSASYELQLQRVFSLIKKYDPLGERTMCVVTKPDNAVMGADDLPQFVTYAQNELAGYCFKLGWHVVKNRDRSSQGQTAEERDESEKDFFTQAQWSGRLKRDQIGINKLRDRLSTLLEQHTLSEMPGVLAQIKETLNETRDSLSKLGPARSTSDTQRLYLATISQNFESLVRQAMNGHYDDRSFFSSEKGDSDARKLRAAIQNLNEEFAKDMREYGHTNTIVGFTRQHVKPGANSAISSSIGELDLPEAISRSAYISRIRNLSRRNRGKELIGSPNLQLVRDLFLEQSRPWRKITRAHIQAVLQCVTSHLSLVSNNVASSEIARTLQREVIYNAIDAREDRVLEKLEELLKPHERGHPITYDLSYIENSKKLIKDEVRARLEEIQSLNSGMNGAQDIPSIQGLQVDQIMTALKLEPSEIEDSECAQVLDCMQAYYEGALRTFIDNIAVLAIEGCVIDDLNEVFSPMQVVKMDEQTLKKLGGESEQALNERLELEQKLKALQNAQRECVRAGATQGRSPSPACLNTEDREHNLISGLDALHVTPEIRSSARSTRTKKSGLFDEAAETPSRSPSTASNAGPTSTPKAKRTGAAGLFNLPTPPSSRSRSPSLFTGRKSSPFAGAKASQENSNGAARAAFSLASRTSGFDIGKSDSDSEY